MHSDLLTLASSRAPRACLDVGTKEPAVYQRDDPWTLLRKRPEPYPENGMHLEKRGTRSQSFDSSKKSVGALQGSVRLVLLMPVRVMDELPVQLLRLFGVELLAAFWALEGARHLDAHVGPSSWLGQDYKCTFLFLIGFKYP